MRPWPALLPALLLAACTSSSTLLVDLRTELRPGVEAVRVETSLYRGTGLAALDQLPEVAPARALMDGEDAFSGLRVAQYDALARGDYLVRVRLLDARGNPVGRGTSSVALDTDSRVVTVIVNGACRDVECPEAGGPNEIACLAGRCVDPDCPNDPSRCPPPECTADETCADGDAACVVGACLVGFCVTVTDDSLCTGGRCDRATGCDALADAGAPDAGAPDAGPSDAGPPCDPVPNTPVNYGFRQLTAGSPTWSAPSRTGCPAAPSGETPYFHEVVLCNQDSAPRGFVLDVRSHGSLPTIASPTVFGYRGAGVPADPGDCAWVASGVGDTAPYELLQPGESFTLRLGGVTTGAEGALAIGLTP